MGKGCHIWAGDNSWTGEKINRVTAMPQPFAAAECVR